MGALTTADMLLFEDFRLDRGVAEGPLRVQGV